MISLKSLSFIIQLRDTEPTTTVPIIVQAIVFVNIFFKISIFVW